MKQAQKISTALCILISSIGILILPRGIHALFQFESQVLTFVFKIMLGPILVSLGVIYFVLKVEKRSLSSIGFKKFKAARDIKWGLIGFVLGGMSFAITGPIVEMLDLGSTYEGVEKMAEVFPVWQRIIIAFIAGFSEEIIFRTYPIERLKEWTGSIWFAAILSIVIFAVMHIPFWELGGAIQIGVGTIIWTLIYVKTRSIWPMIIMHVINDLFAFVLLPYLFA